MKKYAAIYIIGIVMMCLLLSSCSDFDIKDHIPGMWDPYLDKRPPDYAPSKWVSEDPNIWFEVLAYDDYSEQENSLHGEIILDNKIIEVLPYFNRHGSRMVTFYYGGAEGGALLQGSCRFSPEKLVITVDKKNDKVFRGQYDTITFVREAAE